MGGEEEKGKCLGHMIPFNNQHSVDIEHRIRSLGQNVQETAERERESGRASHINSDGVVDDVVRLLCSLSHAVFSRSSRLLSFPSSSLLSSLSSLLSWLFSLLLSRRSSFCCVVWWCGGSGGGVVVVA